MFGIGFTEFTLIFIVAILFLGPDKLPGAIADIAKMIKSVKKTINDAKDSLEEEIKVADLKAEALSYKSELDDATKELSEFKNLRFDDFDEETTYDEEVSNNSPMQSLSASERHRLQIEKEAKRKQLEAAQNEPEVEQAKSEEVITKTRKKPKETKDTEETPKEDNA